MGVVITYQMLHDHCAGSVALFVHGTVSSPRAPGERFAYVQGQHSLSKGTETSTDPPCDLSAKHNSDATGD
jgi:hypothetical protein